MSVRPRLFPMLLAAVCGFAPAADRNLFAQAASPAQQSPAAQGGQPAAPTPEGYWPRGQRPKAGLAPRMRVTELGRGGRTFRLNFSRGDEVMSGMVEFAQKHKIRNGHFTGIGAVNRAVLGWTDTERSNAQKMIPINEEAELIAFSGSISTNAQGVSTVHGHGAVSLKNGSVVGGHVFELHISIIGEVFVTEGEGSADAAR